MKPKLSLVTLGVADLDRSREFYGALGWVHMDSASDQVVFFELGGVVLSLYPRTALAADAGIDSVGSGFSGITLAHNEPSTAAADRAFDEFVAAGATVIKPGVAIAVTSPTPMGTCGKSPTTRSTTGPDRRFDSCSGWGSRCPQAQWWGPPRERHLSWLQWWSARGGI